MNCQNNSNCQCRHLPKIGATIARLGLAFTVIWFGTAQLKNPADWVDMVPNWVSAFTGLSPATLVILNGWFELIAGLILMCGFLIGPVALFLAIHILIIAFSIGFNSVAVRDIGLACALFGLGLKYLPQHCRCQKNN